jgi:hypothetical protein
LLFTAMELFNEPSEEGCLEADTEISPILEG